MFTTIITDCRDDNAATRQLSRASSLLETNLSFIGVQTDIEAAGNLIDIIDATEGRAGIILVNVAPRGGHTRKWENGTPFGYFWYKETLIVSTVDGLCLSGIKRHNLTEEIRVLDTHSGSEAMRAAGFIDTATAEYIPQTQFRSFDFTPRIAHFLFTGHTAPATPLRIAEIPDLPPAVWWIDSFGNCKTTLTQADSTADTLETRFGTFPIFAQLKDLPDGEAGFVVGSSGLPNAKYLELNVQRGNAAQTLGITIGDNLFTEENHGLRV